MADDNTDVGAGTGVSGLDAVVDKVDALVPVAADAGNEVLVDDSRLVRWAAPLFIICVVLLVPWIIVLGLTLPQRELSDNYDLAWTGYDVLLLLALGATGFFALRRSRWLPIAASAAGTLLVADAWFDVLATPGGAELAQAIAMCVLVELPLSGICFWLAVHSQEIAERRIVMLQRRSAVAATARARTLTSARVGRWRERSGRVPHRVRFGRRRPPGPSP